ncbi:hypothetical protein Tco_0661028 [Tanacetum coccineum]
MKCQVLRSRVEPSCLAVLGVGGSDVSPVGVDSSSRSPLTITYHRLWGAVIRWRGGSAFLDVRVKWKCWGPFFLIGFAVGEVAFPTGGVFGCAEQLGGWKSRDVGIIWSFSVLGVCNSTKIPFVCKYGLTSEWDSEDLTELLKRKSDEFVLNQEGDKNDAKVIFLKSDLTIKV